MSGCNTQCIPDEQKEGQNQDTSAENNLLNGAYKLRTFSLLSESWYKKS